MGLAGRLQPRDGVRNRRILREAFRQVFRRRQRADNLGIALVRIRPVDFSDDLCQRLRGGRRLLLRRGECA